MYQRRTAKTEGETYPEAYALVSGMGITLFCNVSITWAGATPTIAKQRIDDAVQMVWDVYNQQMTPEVRRELEPYGIEINSTNHQGVVQLNMLLDWSVGGNASAVEQGEWRAILEGLGVTVVGPNEFQGWK